MSVKNKIIILLIFFLILSIYFNNCNNEKFIQIAHATGLSKNNLTYTNNPENIDFNYNNGFRYFEVDINLTKDNILVASHEKTNIFTYRELVENKSKEKYVHKFNKILDKIIKYKNIYIILDIKQKYNNKIIKIIEIINKYSEYNKILIYSKIILQIYSLDDFNLIKKTKFKNVLFAYWKHNLKLYKVKNLLQNISNSDKNLFGISLFSIYTNSHPKKIFDYLKNTKYKNKIFFHGGLGNNKNILNIAKNNYNIFSSGKYIKI